LTFREAVLRGFLGGGFLFFEEGVEAEEFAAEGAAVGYATHFMVSFLRFLAQSRRYRSVNFWQESPVSSARPLK
jgi:hypothetical protein